DDGGCGGVVAARGGAWWWGSDRSVGEKHFGTRSENSPKKCRRRNTRRKVTAVGCWPEKLAREDDRKTFPAAAVVAGLFFRWLGFGEERETFLIYVCVFITNEGDLGFIYPKALKESDKSLIVEGSL
ncbi:hypothetical protein Tco_0128187, partial [Tanacetum coccineum]